jgi:hypothetical protein
VSRCTEPFATDAGAGIDASGIYPLSTFMRRMKLGRHWCRSARRAGLPVRRQSGRSFIVGAEFVEWLRAAEGSSE